MDQRFAVINLYVWRDLTLSLPTVHLRQSERYVKYGFRWKDADAKGREEIFERRGVQYSSLNRLANWYPDRDSPLDGMHAAFLGETCSYQ